ncbi:MAG: mucoidy inhibitor MuiA family protein [Eubacterium sp.]|nr:mucoidy inhibitor MuiA family protein [Eubacterium sp.]
MVTKTRVTEVQVYRRSATITRCGEVSLSAGRNIIYVSGMTESADTDSFRLKFPENIKAVNIQIVGTENVKDDVAKESDNIQKKMDEINYQVETTEYMIELRKQNSNFFSRNNISIEEQEKVMAALPEQILALHRKMDELRTEKEKLQEAYDKAVKEEGKPIIMAEVVVPEEGTVPFILQYQDNNSWWTPKYEIRYSGDKDPLEVDMKAQIRQSSGEDWKQVKVTLYTGNPSVSSDLPVMKMVELSLIEPQPKPRGRAKGNGMMAMRAVEECCDEAVEECAPMMLGAAMGMNMAALKMDTADVSEEETMTAYILPNARDILTDTDGNIADLKSFSVKATYHVLTIPSVDNSSYLTAEIVASEWPLPPADAAVYLRDTYAGEVYVDADSDTDLLTLSLGKDERLTVIRTESPKKTQDTFLKGTKKQNCKTEIRLVNTSSDIVSVLLKDQIPVSTDKTITVEPSQLSDAILDAETGELKWELKAEPDKTVVFNIEYTVSWPKEKKLYEKKVFKNAKTKFCQNCGRPVAGRFCPECGAEVK